MMIEQPLAHDEIIDHAELQAQLQTPICLDECIRSAHQAEQAIAMQAGRIINIKLGRVGGFAEAKRVHDVAQAAGIPGVVRRHARRRASGGRTISRWPRLPNFVLPGDVSASKRYWARDIIVPPVGKPRRTGPSSFAMSPASVTIWISTLSSPSPFGRKASLER